MAKAAADQIHKKQRQDFWLSTIYFGTRLRSAPTEEPEAAAWLALVYLFAMSRLGLPEEAELASGMRGTLQQFQDLWTAAKDRAQAIAQDGLRHQSLDARAHQLLSAVLAHCHVAQWDPRKGEQVGKRFLFLSGGTHFQASDMAIQEAKITLAEFQTFIQTIPGHEWLIASAGWKEGTEYPNTTLSPSPLWAEDIGLYCRT